MSRWSSGFSRLFAGIAADHEYMVPGPKAPAYNVWFRPSPSKKIKFKEVARSLLVFTGRLPPAG